MRNTRYLLVPRRSLHPSRAQGNPYGPREPNRVCTVYCVLFFSPYFIHLQLLFLKVAKVNKTSESKIYNYKRKASRPQKFIMSILSGIQFGLKHLNMILKMIYHQKLSSPQGWELTLFLVLTLDLHEERYKLMQP